MLSRATQDWPADRAFGDEPRTLFFGSGCVSLVTGQMNNECIMTVTSANIPFAVRWPICFTWGLNDACPCTGFRVSVAQTFVGLANDTWQTDARRFGEYYFGFSAVTCDRELLVAKFSSVRWHGRQDSPGAYITIVPYVRIHRFDIWSGAPIRFVPSWQGAVQQEENRGPFIRSANRISAVLHFARRHLIYLSWVQA